MKTAIDLSMTLLCRQCSLHVYSNFRPHPKIIWYKDGKEIEKHFMNSTRPSMIFQSDSHMELRLKPVMLEHEGSYRCVAESVEGKDEKVGFLKVNCELRFILCSKMFSKLFQSQREDFRRFYNPP